MSSYITQAVRSRTSYKTTLATIIPIEYKGFVWCVEVSTGCFVARRNGKIFITGNSRATHLLQQGKDLLWVRDYMRHISVKTTEEYLHLVKDRISEELEKT